MAEPTDEQLRDYAAKLPELYQQIFGAFYHLAPNRRERDAVAESSLVSEVASFSQHYEDEIREGVKRLVEKDFLRHQELRSLKLVAPTQVGERLMEAVTGKQPIRHGTPALPVPTWG